MHKDKPAPSIFESSIFRANCSMMISLKQSFHRLFILYLTIDVAQAHQTTRCFIIQHIRNSKMERRARTHTHRYTIYRLKECEQRAKWVYMSWGSPTFAIKIETKTQIFFLNFRYVILIHSVVCQSFWHIFSHMNETPKVTTKWPSGHRLAQVVESNLAKKKVFRWIVMMESNHSFDLDKCSISHSPCAWIDHNEMTSVTNSNARTSIKSMNHIHTQNPSKNCNECRICCKSNESSDFIYICRRQYTCQSLT